jgi:acyl-CoA hydrolase
VAIDAQSRAQAVPQFTPESAAERARYREGELRREFRRALPGRLEMKPVEGVPAPTARPWSFLARSPRPETVSGGGSGLRRRSYIHKIELVRTGKLNFVGTLYGGTLMRWIETTASLSARAYLGGAPVRLVGLHGLTFQKAVRPNRFIHIQSVVAHTARASLTVLVKVQAEEPLEGPNEDALRALLTYTPNQPSRRIEPIECATSEERTLYEEVEQRLTLQRSLVGR